MNFQYLEDTIPEVLLMVCDHLNCSALLNFKISSTKLYNLINLHVHLKYLVSKRSKLDVTKYDLKQLQNLYNIILLDNVISAGCRHTLLLSPKREAYGFGDNNDDQLLGCFNMFDGINTYIPMLILNKEHKCRQILAGNSCSLFIVKDNKIGTYGKSVIVCGQIFNMNIKFISYSKENYISIMTDEYLIFNCSTLRNMIKIKNIQSFFFLDKQILFLSEFGKVYRYNLIDVMILKELILDKKLIIIDNIIKMVSGISHVLFLNNRNEVYGYGNNEWGQVGINSDEDYVDIPTLIMTDIVQISANKCASLALNKYGQVYSWGENELGQLGLENQNNTEYRYPKLIHTLNNIIAISAGYEHSVFLNNNGEIYVCGSNIHGQLGLGIFGQRYDYVFTPMCISNFNLFL